MHWPWKTPSDTIRERARSLNALPPSFQAESAPLNTPWRQREMIYGKVEQRSKHLGNCCNGQKTARAPVAQTACTKRESHDDRFRPTHRSCDRCCRRGGKRSAASVRPGQPAGAVAGLPDGARLGFYEKGNVRIRYADIGSGFPLLATPGGGLNSCIAVWSRAVINIPEEFKNDFRVITMDQRNATGGESTGPVPSTIPGAFADDQLGVMDHLGIDKFFSSATASAARSR